MGPDGSYSPSQAKSSGSGSPFYSPLIYPITMSSIRSQLCKVARQASARRSYSALAAARPQLVQAAKPAFAVSWTTR